MTTLNSTKSEIAITIDLSTYTQVFDESNVNWERKPEYNLLFLKHVQNRMNDTLQARGHVFLNDVHDALGFKRTSAGQIVGWLVGDHIEFNIQNLKYEMTTPSIPLTFNVTGIIYDKI